MRKRNLDSAEAEKLTEAAANTAALAERHESARQRAQDCRERAHLAEADADQAFEDERAQRAFLANQVDEPTTEQVNELKRLAVLAAEARSVADLATSRVQAADKALAEASKALRAAQRVEAEITFHQAQLELSARLLELAPLHERLNETLAQHLALGGMDRPSGLEATFAWARGIQDEAAARTPRQQAARDPSRSVVLLRSIGVDTYGQFIVGEEAGFAPSVSAALVAQGDARWAVDGEFANRSALVRAARNTINRVAKMLGRREIETQEVGWTSA